MVPGAPDGPFLDDLSQVRFVLVEPRSPGNIGAAARAIKNLGFERLDLVRPCADPREAEARRMAVDAAELLERARVHSTVDEALEGACTVVGTSRRTGKLRRPHWRLDEFAPELRRLARAGPVAILFGREAHGLTAAELDRCTHLVHLLASDSFPSFNLAQAVLLAAYEIRRAAIRLPDEASAETPADHASREAMYAHLAVAWESIGFLHEDTSEGKMRRIRRMLGRACLTPGDVRILRGIARQTLWAARRAGLDVPDDGDDSRPAEPGRVDAQGGE